MISEFPGKKQQTISLAKIRLLVYFQDGGRPPSWICYSPVLDNPRMTKNP